MTAIRFEIRNSRGTVKVPNGMLSIPETMTAQEAAVGIMKGAPPGWRIRLWRDCDLVGDLDSLGLPDVNEVVW